VHFRRVENFGAARVVLRSRAAQLIHLWPPPDWASTDFKRAAQELLEAWAALRASIPPCELLEIARAAERYAERADAPHAVAEARGRQAMTYRNLGRHSEARERLRAARSAVRQPVDPVLDGAFTMVEGTIARRECALDESYRAATKCLAMYRTLYDYTGIALSFQLLGEVAYDLDHANARSLLEQGARAARQGGEALIEADIGLTLGALDMEDGRLVDAESRSQRALEIAGELGAPGWGAEARIQLARITLRRGELAKAENWLLSATSSEASNWSPGLESLVRKAWAELYVKRNEFELARDALLEIHGAPCVVASAYLQLGLAELARHETTAAKQWLTRALTICEGIRLPRLERRVHEALERVKNDAPRD
jgi:tetratricopeptide (TPR) repeat protein